MTCVPEFPHRYVALAGTRKDWVKMALLLASESLADKSQTTNG